MNWRLTAKILHWSLLAVVIVFMVSGLGITYFRVVETATFGLLTKNLAFRIHEATWIPFTVLLILHITVTIKRRKSGKDPTRDHEPDKTA
jgi:cytochrome b subunit of formate dehydrogenase